MTNRRRTTAARPAAPKATTPPEAPAEVPTPPEVPVAEPPPAADHAPTEVAPAEVVGRHAELDGPRVQAGDGRPRCRVRGCEVPEFMDDAGLCGGHWAIRPDLRKEARRGR